uniref:Cytochrome b6-f complex subunit PetP n=1 Tax=Rhodochaete parvula TaxID=110510 RepID=A0A1X9PUU7_9RHOD|nr:hypothetical protein [Rhodochaete parvula]
MLIGQTVIIKQLVSTHCDSISQHLGKIGLIRGLNYTQDNSKILIIELKEHARIWFFEEELQIL